MSGGRKLSPWRTPATEAWDLWGWSNFVGTDFEVTTLPIVDRAAGLFARFMYADALTVARNFGGELLSRDDVLRLVKVGHLIRPSIVREDPLNNFRPCVVRAHPYPGRLSADLRNMTSFDWALAHDQDVWQQLHDGWDGRPVMNAGKWWRSGADKGKAALCGWWDGSKLIQDGTGNRTHGATHFDYATLTMIKRPRRRPIV